MKRIYHEKELEEGDFVLFLYNASVKHIKLNLDYGLVTEVFQGEPYVKWFFDPCEANDDEDTPDVVNNMTAFNGEFYVVKKGVPIYF